jgi:hypothetical protein
VGGRHIQERSRIPLGEKALTKTLQAIDHTGDTSILSESNQTRGTIFATFSDTLIVKESALSVVDMVQHGHVAWLCLNNMTEEKVVARLVESVTQAKK